MSERLPEPDPHRILSTRPKRDEVVTLAPRTRLVRIHPFGGSHPCRWNEFRAWGPVSTARFDHHPPPRRRHRHRRIAYVTHGDTAFIAGLAEYFQDAGGGVGPVDVTHNRPAVTVFELEAPLELLDLDGGWVTRAGGNQAIRTGARGRSREWARTIYRYHEDLAGLAYGSSVWGPGRCAALWERAEPALPALPLATRTLDDPGLIVPIAEAAITLGTFMLD